MSSIDALKEFAREWRAADSHGGEALNRPRGEEPRPTRVVKLFFLAPTEE
jgi:hypothetical protein